MPNAGAKENDRSRRVRDMFGAIAGRYDFLNHFLSANIDRRWRRICVQEVGSRIRARQARILDVGCGTADLSLAFSHLGQVVGCDFCHPMLRIGADKIAGNVPEITLLGADALQLPFVRASFDAVVSAFVLRNLADMRRGIREMRRVLRPGGILGILEFGMPTIPVLAPIYRFYFLRVLPKLGRLISGVDGPYRYLPASVEAFPPSEKLQEMMEQSGFKDVRSRRLTSGIAILLVGTADQKQPCEN